MNTNFEKLLTSVYELEGLLLVIERRKGDVPQFILDRFSEEAQHVADMAKTLSLLNQDEVDAHPCNEPVAIPEQDDEPVAACDEPVIETFNETVAEDNLPDSQPTEMEEQGEEPVTDQEEPEAREEAAEHTRFHDITAAFSINDRFLFQRELFDGDKDRYNDAIELMQRQPNIDKIKEFMTDILQWDTSDEVVKEFVRLVELSFKE